MEGQGRETTEAQTEVQTEHNEVSVLHLSASAEEPEPVRRASHSNHIKWAEEVVDNEHLGKKSSKSMSQLLPQPAWHFPAWRTAESSCARCVAFDVFAVSSWRPGVVLPLPCSREVKSAASTASPGGGMKAIPMTVTATVNMCTVEEEMHRRMMLAGDHKKRQATD